MANGNLNLRLQPFVDTCGRFERGNDPSRCGRGQELDRGLCPLWLRSCSVLRTCFLLSFLARHFSSIWILISILALALFI